ncbi:hypothetical protein [Nocardia lijiangensis]|uniref:hypothetical protein n=1 Tax=Nocardia lijiangensis TaxID=299618 RepID=UPI003D70B7EA
MIARAMDKDSDRRFARCGEFADAALRALAGRATPPMPPRPADHAVTADNPGGSAIHPPPTRPLLPAGAPVDAAPRAASGTDPRAVVTPGWGGGPARPKRVARAAGRQVSSGWRTFSVLLLVSALILGVGAVAAVGVYWKFVRPPQLLPWGAQHSIAIAFPRLIPASPDVTGWRGPRCHGAATVVSAPGDPVPLRQIVCTDPDGVTAWYTEYEGFREVQAYLTAHASLTGEREFSSPGGLQVFRPTDPAAPFALATHGWVSPSTSSILVEVAWPGHTFEEVRDRWWVEAPF